MFNPQLINIITNKQPIIIINKPTRNLPTLHCLICHLVQPPAYFNIS